MRLCQGAMLNMLHLAQSAILAFCTSSLKRQTFTSLGLICFTRHDFFSLLIIIFTVDVQWILVGLPSGLSWSLFRLKPQNKKTWKIGSHAWVLSPKPIVQKRRAETLLRNPSFCWHSNHHPWSYLPHSRSTWTATARLKWPSPRNDDARHWWPRRARRKVGWATVQWMHLGGTKYRWANWDNRVWCCSTGFIKKFSWLELIFGLSDSCVVCEFDVVHVMRVDLAE